MRRAVVAKGQLVLDAPVDLPEGAVVEVTIEEPDDLEDGDVAERDSHLQAGLDEVRRGEGIEAEELIARARRRQ